MCSHAPDTSGVNQAALDSSQTSQQALDWYKSEAARTQGQRDQSTNLQNQIASQQLASMQTQDQVASDYNNYNKTTFRPLEQTIVSNAENYDTPAREQVAADAATADVRAAQAGQQTAQAQSLARMGYDPTSNATKVAATNALQEAGAATGARRTTEATGRAMMSDAAALGRNLPSAQATAIQTGTAAGQAASGAATGAVNTQAQGAALMGQGYGTALQGYQVAGNLYGQQAQLQTSDNSGLFGALGSLGGAAIAKSSKKLKEPGEAMPDDVALGAMTGDDAGAPSAAGGDHAGPRTEALASMSNDAWKYKPGVSDGAVHAGPYAEEARAKLGAKVAPGGKALNMRESAKYNAGAIRELAARADKLERALAAHGHR